MRALHPAALIYRNPAAAAQRLRSWVFWLAALGVLGAIFGMVTERLRVTDGPLTMLAALALVVAGLVHAEFGRRRLPAKLWRLPDGLVIETPGLLRPVRRFVPAGRAGEAEVAAADPRGPTRGLVTVRLPGERFAYLLDPRRGDIPFGMARAEGRERRRGGRRR